MRNAVKKALISGRKAGLEAKQTRLYDKYLSRS